MTENRHRDGDHPSGPALFLLRIAASLRLPGAKARLAAKCKPPHCAKAK
ncbi:hypothetical protein [Streptomyces acidiscabies]|nr:hypothetical protein [Streptomyces acidiscabies]